MSPLRSALPFWMSLALVPLAGLAMARGGWWWALIPAYAWYLVTGLDALLGLNTENPDPETPTARLVWHRAITVIWPPVQAVVLFTAIYVVMGDASVNWQLVYFPLAVVLQFVLLTGIGLVLAPLTVMVNDIQPTVRIFLRIYFYLTPIIFNLELLDRVPDGLRWLFQLNPLTGILELYRAGFFAVGARWHVVGISVAITAATLILGITVFRKLERAVLKEI